MASKDTAKKATAKAKAAEPKVKQTKTTADVAKQPKKRTGG